jgi:hypothetical protein
MRLSELKLLVSEQVVDVQDLVYQLELTIEDILDRFSDKLRMHQEKFGVNNSGFGDTDEVEEEEDEEAQWR